MSEDETTLADLSAARKRFLSLVEDIRPDLHRYGARMMGSVMEIRQQLGALCALSERRMYARW
jgi:hypothetical protein